MLKFEGGFHADAAGNQASQLAGADSFHALLGEDRLGSGNR